MLLMVEEQVTLLVLEIVPTHSTMSMSLSLSHQMTTRMLRRAQRLLRPLRLMAQLDVV